MKYCKNCNMEFGDNIGTLCPKCGNVLFDQIDNQTNYNDKMSNPLKWFSFLKNFGLIFSCILLCVTAVMFDIRVASTALSLIIPIVGLALVTLGLVTWFELRKFKKNSLIYLYTYVAFYPFVLFMNCVPFLLWLAHKVVISINIRFLVLVFPTILIIPFVFLINVFNCIYFEKRRDLFVN